MNVKLQNLKSLYQYRRGADSVAVVIAEDYRFPVFAFRRHDG